MNTQGESSLTRHVVAVAGPPLVLAAVGLSHPQELTPETASRWTTLHLVSPAYLSASRRVCLDSAS